MDAIRVQNLRSLIDTKEIEIKPITILVGANSSGKSTFLRTFPLLKQSIETPTDSPLLWYGRYVDFGSLKDAANRNSEDKTVSFSFRFTIYPWGANPKTSSTFDPIGQLSMTATVNLKPSSRQAGARIASCKILCDDIEADVVFSEQGLVEKIIVDGIDYTHEGAPLAARPSAFILPSIFTRDEGDDSAPRNTVYQPYLIQRPPQMVWRHSMREPLRINPLWQAVRSLVHGKASDETVGDLVTRLRIGNAAQMHTYFREMPAPSSWTYNLSSLTPSSDSFRRLRRAVFVNALPQILEQADEHIAEFASNVNYMGPLRATAQRYYRVQDLAVREVDFRGENFAMFMRSLSENDRRRFTEFSNAYFGFEVSPVVEGGHVAIHLREKNTTMSINLADMGFGYSQVLPVVAQLWSSLLIPRSRFRQSTKTFAIEQPELHLHPAHQARLADMFVGAVRASQERRASLALVIETHSESLINRLGELVNERKIDSEAIQILVFGQRKRGFETDIRRASFDADGALLNWPFGFFAQDPG